MNKFKKIKFVSNFNEDLKRFNEINLEKYDVTIYNENIFKEQKKAFSLKNSFGAKKVPFIVIYNQDNTVFKTFYQESGDSIQDLYNYINGKKKSTTDIFTTFIKLCKKNNYLKEDVFHTLNKLYDD